MTKNSKDKRLLEITDSIKEAINSSPMDLNSANKSRCKLIKLLGEGRTYTIDLFLGSSVQQARALQAMKEAISGGSFD